ncbi:phosphate ABC transporter permease PstA [Fangia hongkongensis]|uniref:phosphate ABC transporter permease PstA n=1 Tax=Fangia hongkongensis TaxID=270495 RepID=UPI00036E4C74|nr:phosphate ABC transporter permease PstA [Fangia hongkongensis]MBK2124740.1 phosphate ABC transporter permease PstA [Fangia hongkongensis]
MAKIGKISTKRKLKAKIFVVLCWLAAIISVLVLCNVLYELLVRGVHSLGSYVFTHDTRELGLRNAIIGSVMLTVGAIVIATPIAILTATFFVEYKQFRRTIKVLRFLNDMMLSTPSVIIGLFIYTLIVVYTSFSGYAGIIALALIAMPMITRAAEDVLYLVSPMLKESAIALGVPKWRVILMVVYRSAKTGLITAVVLATARVMGESAPLLFTSAKNSFLSFNLGQAIESLPVMIFENAMQPYPEFQQVAWTAALIITALVLLMNLSARWLAKDKK